MTSRWSRHVGERAEHSLNNPSCAVLSRCFALCWGLLLRFRCLTCFCFAVFSHILPVRDYAAMFVFGPFYNGAIVHVCSSSVERVYFRKGAVLRLLSVPPTSERDLTRPDLTCHFLYPCSGSFLRC